MIIKPMLPYVLVHWAFDKYLCSHVLLDMHAKQGHKEFELSWTDANVKWESSIKTPQKRTKGSEKRNTHNI